MWVGEEARQGTPSKRPGCPRPCATSRGGGVCSTAGEQDGVTLRQGIRPCRKLPCQIWPRLFHMHTSVTGHSVFQPSWSVNGFSALLHPATRRLQADVPAFTCIAGFQGLWRARALQRLMCRILSGRIRRKRRRLRGSDAARSASGRRTSTVMPSQQASATQERKKGVKVGGGGTLAGRTG